MTLKTTMIAAGALIAVAAAAAPNAAEAAPRHSFGHPGVIVDAHWNGNPAYRPAPRPHWQVLPPRAIHQILRSQGLRATGPIRRKGLTYVTTAAGRDGNLYRVQVNARNGRIIQVRYAGRQHWNGYRSHQGGVSLHLNF
jgi:hypothetical protein